MTRDRGSPFFFRVPGMPDAYKTLIMADLCCNRSPSDMGCTRWLWARMPPRAPLELFVLALVPAGYSLRLKISHVRRYSMCATNASP